MPWQAPRGAVSLTGGGVYDDDQHKKGWQAAVQSNDLAAIAAAKLSSAAQGAEGAAVGAWAPDGIVAGETGGTSVAISLLVVEKERASGGRLVVDGTAYVAPQPAVGGGHLQRLYSALRPTCMLQHCGGSDCAITLSATPPEGMVVPPGCVALDAVQRMNLHVAHNTLYQFELLPSEPSPLVDIQVEAALLPPSMRLWEQIRDLQAGVTPTVTSLPPTTPEMDPTDGRANYLDRHGLVEVVDQALGASTVATVASEASPEAFHALADWFQQQAELVGEPLASSRCVATDAVLEDAEDVEEDENIEGKKRRDLEQAQPGIVLSANALRAALSKGYFRRCLSVSEKVVVVVEGQAILLRVQLVNDKTEDEQALEAVYHCHRGLLTDETEIYIVAEKQGDGVGLRTVVPLEVHGAEPRPQFLSHDACNEDGVPYSELGPEAQPLHPSEICVQTSDDEWFPVKRGLLKCCIALTQALRDKEATSIRVELGCLVFDRVLLFLEAEALGRGDKYDFDINHVEEMAAAADTLGCQPLADRCAQKTGAFFARIKEYRFEEVMAANAAGERLLIIDGMVLDVKRWLPEHPGGSKIIPKQALNYEAGRFFEVYHSSRESFTFLKHFYVGEICAEDRHLVIPLPPPPGSSSEDDEGEDEDEDDDEDITKRNAVAMSQAKAHVSAGSAVSVPASAEFLAALRECTAPFRQAYVPDVFKSF